MTEFFDAVQGKRRMKIWCVVFDKTGERVWRGTQKEAQDYAGTFSSCMPRVVEYTVPFSKDDFLAFLCLSA